MISRLTKGRSSLQVSSDFAVLKEEPESLINLLSMKRLKPIEYKWNGKYKDKGYILLDKFYIYIVKEESDTIPLYLFSIHNISISDIICATESYNCSININRIINTYDNNKEINICIFLKTPNDRDIVLGSIFSDMIRVNNNLSEPKEVYYKLGDDDKQLGYLLYYGFKVYIFKRSTINNRLSGKDADLVFSIRSITISDIIYDNEKDSRNLTINGIVSKYSYKIISISLQFGSSYDQEIVLGSIFSDMIAHNDKLSGNVKRLNKSSNVN